CPRVLGGLLQPDSAVYTATCEDRPPRVKRLLGQAFLSLPTFSLPFTICARVAGEGASDR
ncbi:hypothetical protein JMJ77_0000888, partial [Colletotrichum scovillei]